MARNKLRKEKELNQIKKSTNVFFNIIFIILSALCIFPIVFVFSISISSETSIQKNGYQLIPQELSAAAYQFLWNERGTILHATFISILVTALGIILSVLLTTTMGYVVSRNTYKLKSFYTWVIFIPMIFNGGMLAGYVVNTNILHLRNSIWALILPLAVSPFNIVICKTFSYTVSNLAGFVKEAVNGENMVSQSSVIYSSHNIANFIAITINKQRFIWEIFHRWNHGNLD